jgi:hypothetical protein
MTADAAVQERKMALVAEAKVSPRAIAALGRKCRLQVRAMDSLIGQACIIHRTNYWRRRRTLDKLGIDQLSVGELNRLVTDGSHAAIQRRRQQRSVTIAQ